MALSTRLVFIFLMLAAVAALSFQPADAATDEVAATPDLLAMIPTPFDLGLAGMSSYPVAEAAGTLRSPDELAIEAISTLGSSPANARRAFVDSGLQHGYRFDYRLAYPSD